MCCLINFFADVRVYAYGWVCECVCFWEMECTVCVWIFPSDAVLVQLPLVSWWSLISWCCRGFQNGACGSGISFHCHDNDSDTLAPSLTQTGHCMETGMQFLLQRHPTILYESERSLNDYLFSRGCGANGQLKGEQQNSAIAQTPGCL